MNATSVNGVWEQEITESLSVIVDTNRNQIIKKDKGIPTIHQYPSTPTVFMVEMVIRITEAGDKINAAYKTACDKYEKDRKNKSLS